MLKNNHRDSNSDRFDWNQQAGIAIRSIGQPDFPEVLLSCIQKAVNTLDSGIIYHPKDDIPIVIAEQNKREFSDSRASLIAYQNGFYLLDPFYIFCNEPTTNDGMYLLKDIAPDDFFRSEFYQSFYRFRNLHDEVNYVVKYLDGSSLTLYIGKNGEFSEEEIGILQSICPVVLSLLWRNPVHSILPKDSNTSQKEYSRFLDIYKNLCNDQLTKRQGEIVQLILQGHSLKSTADKLSISTETVKSHRSAAYETLKIKSQTELFSLFMKALSEIES